LGRGGVWVVLVFHGAFFPWGGRCPPARFSLAPFKSCTRRAPGSSLSWFVGLAFLLDKGGGRVLGIWPFWEFYQGLKGGTVLVNFFDLSPFSHNTPQVSWLVFLRRRDVPPYWPPGTKGTTLFLLVHLVLTFGQAPTLAPPRKGVPRGPAPNQIYKRAPPVLTPPSCFRCPLRGATLSPVF